MPLAPTVLGLTAIVIKSATALTIAWTSIYVVGKEWGAWKDYDEYFNYINPFDWSPSDWLLKLQPVDEIDIENVYWLTVLSLTGQYDSFITKDIDITGKGWLRKQGIRSVDHPNAGWVRDNRVNSHPLISLVKEIQRKMGAPETGYFGSLPEEETFKKVFENWYPPSTWKLPKLNDMTDQVKILNSRLVLAGVYNLDQLDKDGDPIVLLGRMSIFDQATKKGIIAFKKRFLPNETPDGKVTVNFWKALMNPAYEGHNDMLVAAKLGTKLAQEKKNEMWGFLLSMLPKKVKFLVAVGALALGYLILTNPFDTLSLVGKGVAKIGRRKKKEATGRMMTDGVFSEFLPEEQEAQRESQVDSPEQTNRPHRDRRQGISS